MLERRNTASQTTEYRCGKCGEPLTVPEVEYLDGHCLPCTQTDPPTPTPTPIDTLDIDNYLLKR